MNKFVLTFIIVMLNTAILMAASHTITASAFYDNLGLYLLGGLTLVVTIFAGLTVVKLLDSMVRTRELEIYEKHGIEEFVKVKEKREPLWRRLYKQATKAVPVSREKEILLDHNYDGIRELDNNLPPWWLALFYVTIVFGVFYFGYYHMSDYGKSSTEMWQEEMAQAEEQVEAFRARQANLVDESNVEALTDDDALAQGKQIYTINCVVCHLDNGAGLVGPNLTDEYWLHGGSIKDVFSTIKYGVPEKGMIAWGTQLRPADIQKVASYILTFQGTNPANGKAPEGEKYVPAEDSESGEEDTGESI